MKLLYCVYGVFIFGKLSPLGDAGTYLNSPIVLSISILRNNTLLVSTLAAILKKVLIVDFFVHLAFCLIAYAGLKRVIDALKFPVNEQYFLIFILSFPSFGMWTSVVSKESITCFFSSFCIIWVLNLLRDEKLSYPFLLNVAMLYLTTLMRPSVGVGVALLIGALYFNRIKWVNKYIRFIAIISGVIFSAYIIYVFTLTYVKDSFIPMAEAYFDPRYYSSTSTREFGFWKTANDFYVRAPYGIFLANLGPTLIECLQKPFFIPYFLEGLSIISMVLILIITVFVKQFKEGMVNSNFIIFLIFGVVSILFINYPFGVYNPGSATRYRSSYSHIILILLFFFFHKYKLKFFNSRL